MKKETDDRITIGLFIDTFYPMVDGVITVVDNYAKRLSKYANVIVFAPMVKIKGIKFDDHCLEYKVVRCKSLKVPFIDYSLPIPKVDPYFIKEINQYQLDIVHIHSPFTLGEAGIKYAKLHHVPVVATMHSQFQQDFKRAVRNDALAKTLTKRIIRTFNKCNECWAVNSEVSRIFYEDYGCRKKPLVMNNATEMLPLDNVEAGIKKINNLHNLKDELVFIFVGRINNLKNIFFIVDALEILKEMAPNLKFKMLFIGTGQDETELKKKIKQKRLKNEVILCGKVVDRLLLASYYARADLFLFPSLYDSSSIVQIEAASQRLPVLFIKGAATADTVINNINGYIEENDVYKYANRIKEIFDNPKLYHKVCENAYHDLYKNWDDTIKLVYARYLKVIKNNKVDK